MKDIPEDQSLIEYPCHFPIKVMGTHDDDFEELIFALVRPHLEHDSHIEIRSQLSKKGNYVSLTVTIWTTSRPQLDSIYRALSKESRCLMVI